MSDHYLLVHYVGKIKKVAILNEKIEVGPVTGAKTAYLYVIINPPAGLPLRGTVSSEEKIGGEEIIILDKRLGGPIAIRKERKTLGGLPYPSIEPIENQFLFILRWEKGRWRVSSP